MVGALPDGLDTRLGPGGRGLSAGEALRAAITRNLAECCDDCRELLRAQLVTEEKRVESLSPSYSGPTRPR